MNKPFYPPLSDAAEARNNAAQEQLEKMRLQLAQKLYMDQSQFERRVDMHNTKARQLFIDRMGGVTGRFVVADTDFLHTHVFENDVFIFFCFNGKEGTMRESINIFPSDQLIAQFRMLLHA